VIQIGVKVIMLNIIFQKAKAADPSKVKVDSRSFFERHKKVEWFQDPFVQRIMSEVDHVSVIDGFVLQAHDGTIIPPEYLCTGTKTAICIYECPDQIFNVTQMGDNVFIYICNLAYRKDVTVLTYRDLPYRFLKELKVSKDYAPVSFEDDIDYYDKFDEWLEEIYND
jgi:hypothetical protein